MKTLTASAQSAKTILIEARLKAQEYNTTATSANAIKGFVAEIMVMRWLRSKGLELRDAGTITHFNKKEQRYKTYDRGDFVFNSLVFDVKNTSSNTVTWNKRSDVAIDYVIGTKVLECSSSNITVEVHGILPYGGKAECFGEKGSANLLYFGYENLERILLGKDWDYAIKAGIQILSAYKYNAREFSMRELKAVYYLTKLIGLEVTLELIDECRTYSIDAECASQFIRGTLTPANKKFAQTVERLNLVARDTESNFLRSLIINAR